MKQGLEPQPLSRPTEKGRPEAVFRGCRCPNWDPLAVGTEPSEPLHSHVAVWGKTSRVDFWFARIARLVVGFAVFWLHEPLKSLRSAR